MIVMTDTCERKGKPKKVSTREELSLLDKTSLIDKIVQLEAHNLQLKNIIDKNNKGSSEATKVRENKKKFDFSRFHKRHIILKLYYLGWRYHGFAVQEDTTNTIEHHLFAALTKSCCVESRQTSNYHRCGRTDKGVSAFSQVISLDIRSKLTPENQSNLREELPYCKILNRLLPEDIRCVAWAPVPDAFSARFDCKRRTYKYFFPIGNLNVEAMKEASKYITGTHDFRNICKMDVGNGVVSFNRTVVDAEISLYQKDNVEGYDMYQLVITSQGFLWHQIRCIMGILLLIGREREKPEVFLELFDIEKCPRKPQYDLAREIPLNLFHCEFGEQEWFVDEEQLMDVIRTLQQEWTINAIKSSMVKSMLAELQSNLGKERDTKFQSDCLLQGVRPKVYQPLMKRLTCESLENRIRHYAKKRKFEAKDDTADNNSLEGGEKKDDR